MGAGINRFAMFVPERAKRSLGDGEFLFHCQAAKVGAEVDVEFLDRVAERQRLRVVRFGQGTVVQGKGSPETSAE